MSLQDAKLILTSNGYKAGKVYAVKPTDGTGDGTVVRNTTKTRVNSSSLTEIMAVNVLAPDYLNGVCPSLNVEEKATNELASSENLENWHKIIAGTGVNPIVTKGFANSPVGINDADRVILDVGTGTGSGDASVLEEKYSQENGFNYNGSFYIKSTNNVTQVVNYRFNSSPNTVITITPEWQLLDFNNVANLTGIRGFGFDLRGDQLNKSVDFLVAKPQLVKGDTFRSSYIPTTTATVTRSADNLTIPIPSGTTEIIEKYEDGTTNTITTIPASPYTVPVGRYEYILMR